MHKLNEKIACAEKSVLVRHDQLPLSCPPDGKTLWNAHPKVYLPLETSGVAACPYCGTSYILQDD